MRSRETILIIGLAVALGVVMYLGIEMAQDVLSLPEVAANMPQHRGQESSRVEFSIDPPPYPEVTLAAFSNDSLYGVRNIFDPVAEFAFRVAEEPEVYMPVAVAEQPVRKPDASGSTAHPADPAAGADTPPPEQEVLPKLLVRGIVWSDNREAIILDVDGQTQILTSERPLSSGVSLVKVDPNEVVVAYQNQEMTLTF